MDSSKKYDQIEFETLLKRFRHLLESNFIASFDEWDLQKHDYKRDISEADKIAHRIESETRKIKVLSFKSGMIWYACCEIPPKEPVQRWYDSSVSETYYPATVVYTIGFSRNSAVKKLISYIKEGDRK